MMQFLLTLLGFINPSNNTNTTSTNQITITVQNSTNLSEDSDTGGDTGPVLPPKK